MKKPLLSLLTACILLAAAGCSEPITHSAPQTESTAEPVQTTNTQTQVEATDPVDTTTTSITTADTTTSEATTTEAASVITTVSTTTSVTTTAELTSDTKNTTTTATTPQNAVSAFVGAWNCVSIEQDGIKHPFSAYAELYGIKNASMTMHIAADGTFSATATFGENNRPVSGTWTEQNGTAVFTAENTPVEGMIRDGQLVLYDDANKVFFAE